MSASTVNTIPQRVAVSRRQKARWGLMLGSSLTVLVILLWATNTFQSFRLGLNNLYYLPKPTSERIVLVAVDDASLSAYGRSPVEWDRSLYAELVSKLNQSGARVIAFDLLFAEATDQDQALADAILAARRNETGVRTRTLIPIVGIQIIPDGQAGYLEFENALTTTPIIAQAADNAVYVNTLQDLDNTVRRQPSLILDGDQVRVSFSLGVLLAYSGIPSAAFPQLLVLEGDALRITPDLTPDRVLTVDRYGLWQQNYFGRSPDSFPVVSFQAILQDDYDPALFADKIVLVGLMQATGVTDQYNVPLSLDARRMAGVEIHANAIESLLQNLYLRPASRPAYGIFLALLTLLTSLLYIQSRWQWMMVQNLGFVVAFFVVAFYIFDSQHLIIDLFDGILAISLPSVGAFGLNITAERRERQRAEFLLASVVSISNQQMNLERIFPLIADDIQKAVKTKAGAIWVVPTQGGSWREAYRWGKKETAPLSQTVLNQPWQEQSQAVKMGNMIAIPFRWQQRLLGGLSVELEDRSADARQLLETLATQITPSFANAYLFTQLQEQNSLLQAWFDVSPNGIFLLDQHHRLLSANPQLSEQLDHLPIEGRIGSNLFDILRFMGVDEGGLSALRGHFEAGNTFRHEIRWHKRSFYFYSIPLSSDSRWLCVLNEITALAELSDLKTQMIRMASHDLKNPLGVITGYTEMLTDSPSLSEEDRKFLAHIQRSATLMRQLIDDILNLEQLKSGRVLREVVNFVAIVREAIEHHEGSIRTKNQELSQDLPPQKLYVLGDPRLLIQSVTNLVGNASKYTPDGGKLGVNLMIQSDQSLRLEVKDSGYGIPADAQDKIFTQFFRARSASTSHIRGTGLGLSLVKSIIEDHGGQVGFTSVEGQGSTFYIELPLFQEKADADQTPATDPHASNP